MLLVAGYWIGGLKIGTHNLSPVERRLHPARCSSREMIRSFRIGVVLMAVLTATDARAITLFRYEDHAQRHCPADSVVWLDFKKRKFYFSGQKLYGNGLHGSFVCLREARRDLYRRSLFGRR